MGAILVVLLSLLFSVSIGAPTDSHRNRQRRQSDCRIGVRLQHYFLVKAFILQAFDCYHNNEESELWLKKLTRRFRGMTDLYSIGKSVNGKGKCSKKPLFNVLLGVDLWVLAIASKDADKREDLRPEVKYVANMHGDEVTKGDPGRFRTFCVCVCGIDLRAFRSIPHMNKKYVRNRPEGV